MNALLTVGVLLLSASAMVAAALFQWGLLLASLTGLIVVGWAVVLTDLQD